MYRKSENIRVVNFLKNFVEAIGQQKFFNGEISYTCKWQHHSEKLKTSSGMKSTEELDATEATMNIKY